MASVPELPSAMMCDICMYPFDHDEHVPLVLPCGHSLCGQCAHGLDAAGPAGRCCPLDRKPFGGELQRNYLALRLLESYNQQPAALKPTSRDKLADKGYAFMSADNVGTASPYKVRLACSDQCSHTGTCDACREQRLQPACGKYKATAMPLTLVLPLLLLPLLPLLPLLLLLLLTVLLLHYQGGMLLCICC
jgi:hypothetical protein